MAEWIPFGHPWQGLNTALDPSEVALGEYVDGSLDCTLDNVERKLERRRGIANQFGTAGIMETGITFNTYTFRGIQLGEFRTKSFGPTYNLSLFGMLADEQSASIRYAQGLYYDPIGGGGAIRRICETANTDFPQNGAQSVKPFAFIGGNRMKAAADRIKHAAGSRNYLDIGGEVCFPSYGTDDGFGIPNRWNKQFPAATDGTQVNERLAPMGLMPPLWMPRITFANTAMAANEEETWLGRDCFYISCLFVKNGAFGPVVEPRPNNPAQNTTTATNYDNDYSPVAARGGYGLIRLSATATDTARFITWSGIPVPPADYDHVVLLRSPKIDGSQPALVPDPSDLRIVAILPAGQKTYVDSVGNDNELVIDPRVRTDPESLDKTIWPPRARYIWPFDQRVAVGYVRENPCALVITARSSDATTDEFNDTDTATPSITPRCYVAVVTADATSGAGGTPSHGAANTGALMLDLIYRDSVAGNVTHRRSYRLSQYTLEELVDRINGQSTSGNDVDETQTRRWHAQLVPGANRAAPATSLRSFGRSTGIGTDFADDTAWTAAVGSSPAAVVGTQFGPQRGFGACWPCLLLFSESYLDALTEFQDTLVFTRGSPGEPANQPDNFSFANFRRPPGAAGRLMGGAPLLNGSLVAYSQSICILRNIRDEKTGVDEDYRIEVLDDMRGAASPQLGVGPGFVVVLTEQGLFAYDEDKRILPISEGLYNPATRTGELAYEIAECVKAAGRDRRQSVGGGSNILDYFNIAIGEGRIVISYRTSSSFDRPNAWMSMDFSPGTEQRGVLALIDQRTGKPFGWGPRCTPKDDVDPGAGTQNNVAFGAMCLMRGDIYGTDAFKWFAFRDKHVSGAVEGRIDEFDVGTEDNGINVSAVVIGKTLKTPDEQNRLRAHEVVVDWLCSDAACTVEHSRSGGAFGTAVSLGNSETVRDAERVPLTLPQRGPSKSARTRFTDPGTGSRFKLWGWRLMVEEVDTGSV